MKAFKQGNLDRFCSVYAVLNACNLMGLKFDRYQTQGFYDDIVERLIKQKKFSEIALGGADGKQLEGIMQFADKFLLKEYDMRLKFVRPFWKQQFSMKELCQYMSSYLTENKTIIARVRSKDFDHWSVVKCFCDTHIRFLDSDDMYRINLNQISPVYKQAKHQICIRNLYCLELVKK